MCETEISNWVLRVVFVLLSHDFKLNNSAESGSFNKKTQQPLFAVLFLFCLPFSLYCNVVLCWFLCAPLSSFLPTFGFGRFSPLVSISAPRLPLSLFLCLSLSLTLLIGPGLPLPTDAAPPTTAQCIRSAAPRGCPRTSQSLFPHSSSLVRRGRKGNRCRRKAGNQKCSVAIKL